jgi:hypothetical protein
LRDELSAVEVYRLAIARIEDGAVRDVLDWLLASHARRARRIREKLAEYGVEPAVSAGARAAFAKAVELGAELLGDRAVLAVLEKGEAQGLVRYTAALDGVDGPAWMLIHAELLPEHLRTHEACRALYTRMAVCR